MHIQEVNNTGTEYSSKDCLKQIMFFFFIYNKIIQMLKINITKFLIQILRLSVSH